MTYQEGFDYQARYDFMCRASAKDNDTQTLSADLNSQLNQLSSYISKDLADLARRGCPDSFADILRNLEHEMVRFREFCEFPDLAQKVVVGVGGKFSAGKSSYINTLLGKKQLVVEIDPTTSLPTYLLKGDEDTITAINIFNKKVTMSKEEFQSLTHEEKSKYGSQIGSLLTSAFISDGDFPWENIALLDTPGYTKPEDDSYSERTDAHIARSQLNASQYIVWLVNAEDGTIKEDDLEFLATLNQDIPRLVLINKADLRPDGDIDAIVALVKKMLADRNLSAVDVIPVSRKKRQYPIEPVLTWFEKWNSASRELTFAKNFKRQFRLYEQYLDAEERKAHMQLNRLNRILTLSEDEDITTDTTQLQQDIKANLAFLEAIEKELHDIQQLFFDLLKVVGDDVGIDMPSLDAIAEMDLDGFNILNLLTEVRESKGLQANDYSHYFKELMLPVEATNLDVILRRTTNKYNSIINEFNSTAEPTSLEILLRKDSDSAKFAPIAKH